MKASQLSSFVWKIWRVGLSGCRVCHVDGQVNLKLLFQEAAMLTSPWDHPGASPCELYNTSQGKIIPCYSRIQSLITVYYIPTTYTWPGDKWQHFIIKDENSLWSISMHRTMHQSYWYIAWQIYSLLTPPIWVNLRQSCVNVFCWTFGNEYEVVFTSVWDCKPSFVKCCFPYHSVSIR